MNDALTLSFQISIEFLNCAMGFCRKYLCFYKYLDLSYFLNKFSKLLNEMNNNNQENFHVCI